MILAWLRPFNNIHLQAAQIVSIYKLQWQWPMDTVSWLFEIHQLIVAYVVAVSMLA